MTQMTFTASQEAALNLEKSVGVTASAGTGKTFLLKNRFIRLLESGAKPGEILCLTFTDKAAADMRDKIEEEIRARAKAYITEAQKAGKTKEEAEDNPLSRALDEIHHCTISTFHGFCSGLLREFPMEAEVPVSYAIMDSLATHNLVNGTIEEVLKHPRKEQLPYAEFLAIHLPAKTLKSSIKCIYDHWESNEEWLQTVLENPRKIYDEWNDQITAFNQHDTDPVWHDLANDHRLQDLIAVNPSKEKKFLTFCSAYEGVCKAGTLDEKYAAVDTFGSVGMLTKSDKFDELREVQTIYKASIKQHLYHIPYLPPFDDNHTQFMFSVLQAFVHLAKYVHDTVRRKMADGGYLNFDDLLDYVKLLLAKKPQIRDELYRRFTYILVDEVQDNDPLQTEIVEILAGDIAGKNKLFVVGDMKQSIYRFRGADPKRVRELLDKFADKPVELDTNYRTVSPLIAGINDLFTRVYAEGNNDGIIYSGVDAARKTDNGTLTILVGKNPKKGGNKKKEVDNPAEEEELPPEGDLLAAWIRDSVESKALMVQDTGAENRGWIPATYGDIAILVRTHNDGKTISEFLKKYHVPFHVYKGKDYFSEPEITDIMLVMRASVFHEDDIALYGALISPYFGISDEQLASAVPPTPDKHTKSLWTRLQDSTDPRIQDALQKLETFKTVSQTQTLSQFVHTIVRDCGILTVYAALEGGLDKVRNIKKFVEIADMQSATESGNIIEFIHTVETCISQKFGSDELGGAEPDMARDNAVNIMTIHASKGLEFKVVALYHMGEKPREPFENGQLVYDPVYHFAYLGLKYPGEDKAFSESLKTLMNTANKPEVLAEGRRVFYVGMTRARDHLVITTKQNLNQDSHMATLERFAPELMTVSESACRCMPDEVCRTGFAIPTGWVPHLSVYQETAPVIDPDAERAMEYGSCMHEIFEGKNIEEVCEKYGLTEHMDRFKEILAVFKEHPFVKSAVWEKHELSFTNANGEIRRADMVVRYEDGTYRIIDFKTDDFRAIPDERRKQYHDQLTEYSKCLTDIYHTTTPIPACFYATRDGVFIDLDDITTYKPQ